MQPDQKHVIFAAGGILLRECEQVLIVYRTKHEDWTLPKGKLEPNESFETAAVREVREETGCTVDLCDYLDAISYTVDGTPKVVLYWRMRLLNQAPLTQHAEVKEVRWCSASEALQTLTHQKRASFACHHDTRSCAAVRITRRACGQRPRMDGILEPPRPPTVRP
jgi:8-oxo-dGTP diphosphatase